MASPFRLRRFQLRIAIWWEGLQLPHDLRGFAAAAAFAATVLPVSADAAVVSSILRVDKNVSQPAYEELLPGFDTSLGKLRAISISISGEYRFTANYSGNAGESGAIYAELLPSYYEVADAIFGSLEPDTSANYVMLYCSERCSGTSTAIGRFSESRRIKAADLPGEALAGAETYILVDWSDEIFGANEDDTLGDELVFSNYRFSSFLEARIDYHYRPVDVAPVPLAGSLPLLLTAFGGARMLTRAARRSRR